MKKYVAGDELITTAKKVHMIGIGGSGMCPLAEILHSKGYELSGSDVNESDPLKRVRALGAEIFMGHKAENVRVADLVVYSHVYGAAEPEKSAHCQHTRCAAQLHRLADLFRSVLHVCGDAF